MLIGEMRHVWELRPRRGKERHTNIYIRGELDRTREGNRVKEKWKMDDGCAAVHGWDSALLSGPIVFFFFYDLEIFVWYITIFWEI